MQCYFKNDVLGRHKNFILKRQVLGLPITKDIIQQYIKSSSAHENFYEFAEKVIEEKKLKDGSVIPLIPKGVTGMKLKE